MDTKEFLIEYNRMCHAYENCCGCPLELKVCAIDLNRGLWKNEKYYFEKNNPKYFGEIIVIVEKWSNDGNTKENNDAN